MRGAAAITASLEACCWPFSTYCCQRGSTGCQAGVPDRLRLMDAIAQRHSTWLPHSSAWLSRLFLAKPSRQKHQAPVGTLTCSSRQTAHSWICFQMPLRAALTCLKRATSVGNSFQQQTPVMRYPKQGPRTWMHRLRCQRATPGVRPTSNYNTIPVGSSDKGKGATYRASWAFAGLTTLPPAGT